MTKQTLWLVHYYYEDQHGDNGEGQLTWGQSGKITDEDIIELRKHIEQEKKFNKIVIRNMVKLE